jgi:hypothetical protein
MQHKPNIAIVCDACNVSNALQFQNVRTTLKKVFWIPPNQLHKSPYLVLADGEEGFNWVLELDQSIRVMQSNL